MKKKIIITESDKNNILKMYGVLNESVDFELLNYGNNYIDSNGCNKIYDDLVRFQTAVNSGQVQMSSSDKSDLDTNLELMAQYKNIFCSKVKEKMKESFKQQANYEPEKLKTYMCWFSKNITFSDLTACKSTPEPKEKTKETSKTEIEKQNKSEKVSSDKKNNINQFNVSLQDRVSGTPQGHRLPTSTVNNPQKQRKITTTTSTNTIYTQPKINTISSKKN